MKNEDKVATLEQCKKLVELGVILRTEKYWVSYDNLINTHLVDTNYTVPIISLNFIKVIPAPDVVELGMLLPKFIIFEEYRYWLSLDNNITTEFGVSYKIDNHLLNSEFLGDKNFYESLEAQARAEALIWLLENDFLIPGELKL